MTFYFNPNTFGAKTTAYVHHILKKYNIQYEELSDSGKLTADLSQKEFQHFWEKVESEADRDAMNNYRIYESYPKDIYKSLSEGKKMNPIPVSPDFDVETDPYTLDYEPKEDETALEAAQNKRCDSATGEFVWTGNADLLDSSVKGSWGDTQIRLISSVAEEYDREYVDNFAKAESHSDVHVHPLVTEAMLSNTLAEEAARLYKRVKGSGISPEEFSAAFASILKEKMVEDITEYDGI